jgi:hypothetical protein
MYAVFDPRVSALNDLREAQWPVPSSPYRHDAHRETARRESQWATWQMDRSWPDRSHLRRPAEPPSVSAVARGDMQWKLTAAAFLALGVVAAGLLTVGIERGLL